MGLEKFSAFLPYDTFEIKTPYTPEEVVERIQANIEERSASNIGDRVKRALRLDQRSTPLPPFLGTVEPNKFHLYSSSRNQNSFRPQFYGTITPTPSGTLVQGYIQVQPIMLLIVGLLEILFLTMFISVLLGVIWGTRNDPSPLWYSGAFIVGVYIITMVNFYMEATPAKKQLYTALGPHREKAVRH